MEKYTRGRGISYPILSLEKAIKAVKQIDSEYQKAAIDREAAAILLGFSGLTGSSGRTLGALGSYGLTDRSGPGKITVSELARSIIYPVDAKERVNSIKEAISNPPLFSDISDQFEGSDKPSENGVKIYLRRKGMPPKAVSKAVESYMDSINYVISEEMNAAYKTRLIPLRKNLMILFLRVITLCLRLRPPPQLMTRTINPISRYGFKFEEQVGC